MLGVVGSCCCSGACGVDCLFGADTVDGCCHKADSLLLWNERPAFSSSQHYVSGSGGCEVCRTSSQSEMGAVQSIYHFYNCFYKAQYPTVSPKDLVELPTDDNTFGQGAGCANPACNPAYSNGASPPGTNDVCCNLSGFDPGNCIWGVWWGFGQGGLSQWRVDTLYADDDTRWFIEMIGHKEHQSLGGAAAIGSLDSTFQLNLYHERWWKSPDTCSSTEDVIYVPDCAGGACSGVPFTSTDLVPRWWIFACSGIPLYSWELDDAVDMGVLTAGEKIEITDKIALKQQLPQAEIKKFAKVYSVSKDWRADQNQIYTELHKRFPDAGYDAFIVADCASMPMLGPFRKRLTHRFDQLSLSSDLVPLLHKDDVISQLAATQAQWIPYPGAVDALGLPTSEDDYNYWRERQWVYFSGVPAGWTWAGWTGSEEQILDGIDRETGLGGPQVLTAPMLAFRGEPRPNPTCTPCAATPCPDTTFCGCGSCSPECDTGPIASCDPPSSCERFVIQPYCEGVRFVYHRYYYEHIMNPDCTDNGRFRCLMSVKSYLTEAKRTLGDWGASCPQRCSTINAPPFAAWTEINSATTGEANMCADIIWSAVPIYSVSDLCCGAFCWDANTVYGFPCQFKGEHNDCPAHDDCPPHSTTGQIDCIGHDIEDCSP